MISEGGWDLLCHHAADVTNYKSPDFDAVGAVQNNTRNLVTVLQALKSAGCGKSVLTGTVFEGGEGAGSQGLPDFSPYGLSKALTASRSVSTASGGPEARASSSFPIPSAPTRSLGSLPTS